MPSKGDLMFQHVLLLELLLCWIMFGNHAVVFCALMWVDELVEKKAYCRSLQFSKSTLAQAGV